MNRRWASAFGSCERHQNAPNVSARKEVRVFACIRQELSAFSGRQRAGLAVVNGRRRSRKVDPPAPHPLTTALAFWPCLLLALERCLTSSSFAVVAQKMVRDAPSPRPARQPTIAVDGTQRLTFTCCSCAALLRPVASRACVLCCALCCVDSRSLGSARRPTSASNSRIRITARKWR